MWHWFPENVSTFGAKMDSMFMIILWITGVTFVLVEAAIIYFALKYRHRPGRKAVFVHGNKRLEIIWTSATFVIVMFVAAISMEPWMAVRNPARFPAAELQIEVTAKQFEWRAKYPGADGRLGTADDFTSRNQLHVPVDRAVHVLLLSEDVIHSFFLPHLRVKQDAVPGMRIPIWFEATKAGDYVLGCAELCGLGHYRMKGIVRVHEAAAFDTWHSSGGKTAPTASASASPPVVAHHAH
jgi:cytochrome c oxidase subunit II